MLQFAKMNGAGNDFVLIDNRAQDVKLTADQIRFLCDRHRGVGADGILLVEPASCAADFRMRYYNKDGGEAEMCGNGARCFARFASRLAGPFSSLQFETPAGVIEATLQDPLVTVRLSTPGDLALSRTIEIGNRKLLTHSINTGVPHVVTFVDDLERTPVHDWGAQIRYHTAFQPKGTNANFVQVLDARDIAIRTYERGVEEETLACGTGVAAAALVHAKLHEARGPISVLVRSGDRLTVGFENAGQHFDRVTLTGPADFVFAGQIELA
jgi:diaminopimelate epimerase